MSRYAHLACMDNKVLCFVGKAIRHPDDQMNFFHIGGPWEPLNWQRPELNQVIWKMLADHAGHHLKVLVSGDKELDQIEFVMIGGTSIDDISDEDYLRDWDGLQSHTESELVGQPAFLACLESKVLCPLGTAIYHPDGRINYFHLGAALEPLNWQQPELNQVLWKMLADHAGQPMKVLVAGDAELEQFTFLRIGDVTGPGEISRTDYLDNWEGKLSQAEIDQKKEPVNRLAFLACLDCKVECPLGRAIYRLDRRVNYYHIGYIVEPKPLNWERPELNQVLWKMLADHAGHHLKVIMDGDREFYESRFESLLDTSDPDEIDSGDYLKDWDGLRGPTGRE